MTGFWTRLRFASPRRLALAGLLAVVAAGVLDGTGPHGRFEGFFVGVLFGLGLGLGVFALGAYRMSRP